MMVPKLIKRHNIEATIGIFMHSPFPSSDVFKMLPKRIEVLSALVCCDLIGFHLFEHARNFFTACRRVLGLNHEFKKGGFLQIECNGRPIMIRVSHIGVDVEDIN
jgi:trehalose 6-phosphate synthase/phosphatase